MPSRRYQPRPAVKTVVSLSLENRLKILVVAALLDDTFSGAVNKVLTSLELPEWENRREKALQELQAGKPVDEILKEFRDDTLRTI